VLDIAMRSERPANYCLKQCTGYPIAVHQKSSIGPSAAPQSTTTTPLVALLPDHSESHAAYFTLSVPCGKVQISNDFHPIALTSRSTMAFFVLVLPSLAVGVATALVYNLLFHPLARVSGPLLARISISPSFYHAIKGDRHIWIWQDFQIYGDTFRAAPNLVLFNDPRAYTDIYVPRANITRSSFYRT
jgi:hypothetical protein